MLQLLKDQEYLPVLVHQISQAQKTIQVRMFLIDPGESETDPVRQILRELAKTVQRGVAVSILTEGIFESKMSGIRLKQESQALGLAIKWNSSEGPLLHEKSVELDENVLLIGSHNWNASSLTENRELSLLWEKRKDQGIEIKNQISFLRSLSRDIRLAKSQILLASYDWEIKPEGYDAATILSRNLLQAHKRGVHVEVLLDASRLFSFQKDVNNTIQFHGENIAQALKAEDISVIYDTPDQRFHGKAAVIDKEIVYIGSQNLSLRKDIKSVEKTARILSKELASDLLEYLHSIAKSSGSMPSAKPNQIGIPIPFSFIEKDGIFNRLYRNHSESTLKFYLSLFHETWTNRTNILTRSFPEKFKDDRRRLEKTYRGIRTKPGSGARKPVTWLLNPETGRPLEFPRQDFFVLPREFFDWGWHDRLRSRETYLYLIHLMMIEKAKPLFYWSLANREISEMFAIDGSQVAHGTIYLERWNLIEVIRHPEIVIPSARKRKNKYRVNPPWTFDEWPAMRSQIARELQLPEASVDQAQQLAAILNQPYDPVVFRRMLLLIEQFGLPAVQQAVDRTAKFKTHFALRNISYVTHLLRKSRSLTQTMAV